jgi:hypothetical protein
MIEGLKLGRWRVADGAMETPVIPPVDPLRGCQLHLLENYSKRRLNRAGFN